jgi:hypothetical protein
MKTRVGVVVLMVFIAAIGGVLWGASVSGSGPTIREAFVNADSPNYVVWGVADPFNRLDAFNGNLELEGSYGYEGFGIYFKQMYDISKGPLTVSFDLVRDSGNTGSEICIWFVNQYLPDGSPWDEGDFVRAMFTSEGNKIVLQETSPAQRGMGTILAEAPGAFVMEKKYHVDFIVDAKTVTLKMDGKVVLQGKHTLTSLKGYVHLHDWNSLEGDVDLVSKFIINP